MRLIVVSLVFCAACANAGQFAGDGARDFGTTTVDGATTVVADGSIAGDDLASAPDLAPPPDTLAANRDRLLRTYLAWLVAHPGAQTNGLDGATLAGVCDLWSRLDPSSRGVFQTLTARMQASRLPDGTSMLAHVTRLYRAVGGQGATATSPGSCGGGEYNRMIMSIDATLHTALVAANHDQGAPQNGVLDLADGTSDAWRDSHDAGGPHAPFDLSDETNNGAPRGQVQYFADPTSSLAQQPLGRVDLMMLVDPFAMEMDQDYDCVHNSNPLCSYITYGPLCAPEASMIGIDLYAKNYGAIDAAWAPSGC